MKARILLFALVIWSSIPVLAQDQCEQALQRATDEFNSGHFSSVPSILAECISGNQTASWRQRAFLLLAQTYLLMDDQFGADQSYLQVLKANPEYTTDLMRDPSELVYLSKKFTAEPIFSLFGRLGGNVSPVSVIHNVSMSGEPGLNEKYQLRGGWNLGAGVEYHYTNYLSAVVETNLSFTSFKHVTTNLFGSSKDELNLTSRQTTFSIPLTIKYTYLKGRFKPFVYGGLAINFLVSDKAGILIVNRDTSPAGDSDPIIQERESPSLNLIPNRTKLAQAYVIGGGLRYKYGLNYFFGDIRWVGGLRNHVDPNNRFNGTMGQFPYTDDDFRLNNLSVNIGFIYPLYKPRKIKRVKTVRLLKEINKADEN